MNDSAKDVQEYRGQPTSTTALVLDGQSMEKMMSMAEFMSKGIATVPKHLQKNPSDCLAIIMQAVQWKMNPFAVAQKTHVVSGTLGYEAQLVNAVITSLAPTKDRIHYEWFGEWNNVIGQFKEITSKTKTDPDTGEFKKYRVPNWPMEAEKGLGVKVWATMRGESEPRELVLELSQCRVRNSPLWADDPRQQIAYLAVKRWSRLYCPDVILGVYSADELDAYGEVDITSRSERVDAGRATELPAYPDEDFDKNFPKWGAIIESGKKTPQQIIDTVSSKAQLSEGQRNAILDLSPVTNSEEEAA